MSPLYEELCNEFSRLETQINLWYLHVFDGRSSGFAIKQIMES